MEIFRRKWVKFLSNKAGLQKNHKIWQNLSKYYFILQNCVVSYTFYPNTTIFLHRYICHICDILQLCWQIHQNLSKIDKNCQNLLKLSKIVKIVKNCKKNLQNSQNMSKLSKNCQYVGQVMFSHHCDQMSQRSQVYRVAL